MRGLADSLPDNVTLYENSAVTKIEYGDRILITTPKGSIQAPAMILTVNGFGEQFGFSGASFEFRSSCELKPTTYQ